VLATECILAESRGISVVGHVDGDARSGGEFSANIGADPILTQVCTAPNDAIAAWGWNVQTHAGDVVA
jgi:hypothetical protein